MHSHILKVLVLAALLVPSPVRADEDDVAEGAKHFKKCAACHSVKDNSNKTGPHLLGIVGRPIASVEGFKYSKGLQDFAATGDTWDEAELDTYIEKPKALVPTGTMPFAGIKKPEERAALITYLKTVMP